MSEVKALQDYHLVIMRGPGSHVLLTKDVHEGSASFHLPKVTIPKWERSALNITTTLREQLGLETLCLFQPDVTNEIPTEENREPAEARSYVVEACDPQSATPPGMKWVTSESLDSSDFAHAAHFTLLQHGLKEVRNYSTRQKPGPFAKVGWLGELFDWARPYVEPLGLRLTGRFQQYNGAHFFSLLRLESNGPAVWFKAVGEPNLREFGITVALAATHAQYVPKIFAVRNDWHGWLMEDLGGNRLIDIMTLSYWERTVRTLAELQVDLAGDPDRLLGIGCTDWRIPNLLARIDPFLDMMSELMRQQKSTPPSILSESELKDLGRTLKAALYRLQELHIPDTFTHGDFGPGNIMVTPDRCVLIDLAEGYLGNPFLTFQYLLDWLNTFHPQLNSWNENLRRVYGRCWREFVCDKAIEEGLCLARLLTVVWHAAGGNGWQDPRGFLYLQRAKYYRSLTRKMYQRALDLKQSEVACTIS